MFGGGKFLDVLILAVPAHSLYSMGAVILVLIVFGRAMARIIGRVEESEDKMKEAVENQGWALAQVKRLSGLLPMCL